MTTPTKNAAPEAREAEVRVRDLSVHYRINGTEYPAVANASLDLRRGEITGLVGSPVQASRPWPCP